MDLVETFGRSSVSAQYSGSCAKVVVVACVVVVFLRESC